MTIRLVSDRAASTCAADMPHVEDDLLVVDAIEWRTTISAAAALISDYNPTLASRIRALGEPGRQCATAAEANELVAAVFALENDALRLVGDEWKSWAIILGASPGWIDETRRLIEADAVMLDATCLDEFADGDGFCVQPHT